MLTMANPFRGAWGSSSLITAIAEALGRQIDSAA